ncbi:hypothetical protein OG889_16550 [Streptomyces sp. NBC_00481]|uniref:hypothetical protein n=1 Tax=Streptomyces sp. NBC_00481 TaxID=2975755 RepID=UPI002DD8A8FB|nr:hypothetical protein [Streptomyces sp. NBC_00481]WRY96206.1 hypothetical protein OG889_16550 [Streptomyces sp. NBC_00481]
MTSAAALPGAGAVLRVVRGAAGRRLVQVALLVGGLFVLGVLCGERASAAEGTPTSSLLPTAVTAITGTAGHALPPVGAHVVAPVARDVVEPVTGRAVRSTTERVARPVTERAVRPVTEQVARPVTEDVMQPVVEPVLRPVTEHVARPVTEHVVQLAAEQVLRPVVEDVVRPVTDSVVLPVAEGLAGATSQLPPVSGVPSLPGIPGLPGWTTLPVETPPVDATPLEPGRAGAERPGSTVDGDGGRNGEPASRSASVAYGPNAVAGGAPAGGAVAVTAPHRHVGVGGSAVVRVPAQQNPGGLPTGSLGRHSAVDNGGPRHAESYAVASPDPAPASLVPGAPATDAADGTRDRHRDIPEFPG